MKNLAELLRGLDRVSTGEADKLNRETLYLLEYLLNKATRRMRQNLDDGLKGVTATYPGRGAVGHRALPIADSRLEISNL